MTLLQLNPSLPVFVLDKGEGEVLFLLDYGKEDSVFWGVAMQDSGQVWWVPNEKIRFMNNYTIGRKYEIK